MSARHGGRAAQPVFELSFNPEEIKARLNAVPVYTVVNKKNEFVLVAGDVSLRSFPPDPWLWAVVERAAGQGLGRSHALRGGRGAQQAAATEAAVCAQVEAGSRRLAAFLPADRMDQSLAHTVPTSAP